MNIELLLQVKESILEHPGKFNMDDWKCKTAMCIGGWACKLSKVKIPQLGEFGTARDLLGLTSLQGNKLFFIGDWPAKFNKAYYSADDSAARAQVAADRIDHFIKRKV